MSMNAQTVDRTTLPTALLDLAKSHLRVRHTRDDTLIGVYIGQAIDEVERRCNINLNPAVFEIDVYALPCCAFPLTLPCVGWPAVARLALPVNNVHAFTLTDPDGVDQSDAYVIEQADLGGSAGAYLVGPALATAPPAAAWTMTTDVGVDTADAISPAVLAVVLRLVGGYYENRESPSAVVVDDFQGELAAVWRPGA
jgi:hypothetical protein